MVEIVGAFVPNIGTPMATVHKSIEVLCFLNAQGRRCGVSEVALGVGVPKTTAHRLLRDLLYRDVVELDEDGRYGLGLGLVALGLGAARGDRLLACARPCLHELASRLDESAFLVAARGGALVVLDKVEAGGTLRLSPQVGGIIPVEGTAVGQIYRAHAPHRVSSFTVGAQTMSSVSSPGADLVRVRAQGWALSDGQWIEGLMAVASGVWLGGQLCGVVAVASTSPRFRERGTAELTSLVCDAARAMERRLSSAAATRGE